MRKPSATKRPARKRSASLSHGGSKQKDMVNHPSHYKKGSIEVIEMIEDVAQFYKGDDAYSAGCVIKYLARAPHKGNFVQDLQKAKWYLDNLLSNYVDMNSGKAF